jgi:hypothetical protein
MLPRNYGNIEKVSDIKKDVSKNLRGWNPTSTSAKTKTKAKDEDEEELFAKIECD